MVATPRGWLSPDSAAVFGRPGAEWRRAPDRDAEVALAVAQLQHAVVSVCRQRLEQRGVAVGALATDLRGSVPSVATQDDMLRRKFRGEAPAQLADLVAWLGVLDIDYAVMIDGTAVSFSVTPFHYRRCQSGDSQAGTIREEAT